MFQSDYYLNKKISIFGAGVSGRSLSLLAKKMGATVFVSDSNELSLDTVTFFRVNSINFESSCNSAKLFDADEIIVSSGISPDNPMLLEAVNRGITVKGELDFISQFIDCPVIAVTGSNGKTTTTSMIGDLLKKAGYKVGICGNIGNPIAKVIGEDYDYIVAELSSFQLYRAKTFKCDIAIVTNLAPDHITWHGSYENYVKSKAKIISSLRDNGFAIYQKRDELAFEFGNVKKLPLSWSNVSEIDGIYLDSEERKIYLRKESKVNCLLDFNIVKLLGNHNLENVAMVVSVLSILNLTINKEDIISFVPPKHRCAFVEKIKGITFVDDSKGTNVAASVTAMTSISGRKIVILGGQGKGEDYSLLAETVIAQARYVVLIGEEKLKIANVLDKYNYREYKFADNMAEAVDVAYSLATENDIVLLSPACTSWDMYPSYAVRGDDFVNCVKTIKIKEND
ncbi:MAG: UDP-N-acetylmuramoyl-L-alanine--D-glutamate ligase [Synergistaceae bacterium]